MERWRRKGAVRLLAAASLLVLGDGYGIITARPPSLLSLPVANSTSPPGSICLLADADTKTCMRSWAANPQSFPTTGAIDVKHFSYGSDAYLMMANHFLEGIVAPYAETSWL